MNTISATIKCTFLTALSLGLLTGCMSFNPRSMRQMEAALIESNPDLVIESSRKFGVGGLTLDLVDFAFVHDRHLDISRISRAEIGIYELDGTVFFNDFQMPQADASDRNCPRRDVIIRVRENDEHLRITACIRSGKVTGLSMFVLEPREIVVVNLRGDLEAVVNSLVRDSFKNKNHTHAGLKGADDSGGSVANRGANNLDPPT